MYRIAALVASLLFAAGCVHTQTQTTPPMGVTDHEAVAAAAQRSAATHQEQLFVAEDRHPCSWEVRTACVTVVTNVAEEHQRWAEHLHKLAAQHLGAAQALRYAQWRACRQVGDAELAVDPFAQPGHVRKVEPYYRSQVADNSIGVRLAGAIAVLEGTGQMTAHQLQNVIDCRLAQNAALGFKQSSVQPSPLNLPHVQARVRPGRDGLTVVVRSDDEVSAAQLVWRLKALLAPDKSNL